MNHHIGLIKLKKLNNSIGKQRNAFRIVDGEVILLKGDPETIAQRVKSRTKELIK